MITSVSDPGYLELTDLEKMEVLIYEREKIIKAKDKVIESKNKEIEMLKKQLQQSLNPNKRKKHFSHIINFLEKIPPNIILFNKYPKEISEKTYISF